MRIDKYLWTVRLFKTRSLAAQECDKGHINVNGVSIKPSKIISIGDKISVRKPPINYIYEVIGFTPNRVSASLVANFLRDITPKEEIERAIIMRDTAFGIRDRGAGRPTKRDRREIDKWLDFEDEI